MSAKKKKKARLEVSDRDLEPGAVRRRISIMIPEDVLGRLRAFAAYRNISYQTLVNEILFAAVTPTEEARILARAALRPGTLAAEFGVPTEEVVDAIARALAPFINKEK